MHRTDFRNAFLAFAVLAAAAAAQAPDFRRIMITEVSWADPQGVEITNFSTSAIGLTGWNLSWRVSPTSTASAGSVPLAGTIQPGESIVVTEVSPAPIPEAPAGTQILPLMPAMSWFGYEINFGLSDPANAYRDVVHVSATSGTSAALTFPGATFRGLALHVSAASVGAERIWGLDSDGGRDWTEENVRSFGLENRTAGPRGTDPVTEPRILFTEIDDSPDYLELFNNGPAAVDLRDFLILAIADQGAAPVRVVPFPASFVLASGGYLVIGDTATVPAEKPAGVPYVVVGVNLPTHWEECSLALYDNLGRLLDLVRVTGDDDEVVHNHPRAPAAWNAFTGAAPRQGGIGGGSFGRERVGSTFVDTDRGSDWRALFLRSMGSYNAMWVGAPGLGDVLDVRIHETSAGEGLTIILNGGSAAAGFLYSYFFSLGHASGTGPFYGLGQDAITNWLIVLATPPFSGVLDGRGSARVDLPSGALPPGVDVDCIFILQSAAGALQRRTAILEYDT